MDTHGETTSASNGCAQTSSKCGRRILTISRVYIDSNVYIGRRVVHRMMRKERRSKSNTTRIERTRTEHTRARGSLEIYFPRDNLLVNRARENAEERNEETVRGRTRIKRNTKVHRESTWDGHGGELRQRKVQCFQFEFTYR